MKDTCTIWMCQDCMLHHCNGECGSCHTDEGHDREPLGLVDDTEVAMGMLNSEHAKDCGRRTGSYVSDCDCEIDPLSTSACQGCGSTLHGKRHAMTLWFEN